MTPHTPVMPSANTPIGGSSSLMTRALARFRRHAAGREGGFAPAVPSRVHRPEIVLSELRRLLLAQETVPLPAGWDAEVVVHTWGRDLGSQDLLVGAASPDRCRTDVLTLRPGAESAEESEVLLLSAALTALTGSVEPVALLPAVAGYLRRMGWTEPVPAACLGIDTSTGHYVLCTAGAYAAAQLYGGSGRWSVLPPATAGPLEYGRGDGDDRRGSLARGDALVVFAPADTSVSARQMSSQLDRLLGEVDGVLTQSRGEESGRLVARLGASAPLGTVLLLRRRR